MNQGASAQLLCIVTQGDQPLSISWSFHGSNITSDLGITTMPTGPMGSLLMIPSVGHKHRGTYTCKASNKAGVRTESVELNVNGKLIASKGKALQMKSCQLCLSTNNFPTQNLPTFCLFRLDLMSWMRAPSPKCHASSTRATSPFPSRGPSTGPTSHQT